MSNQIQATGAVKIRSLTGALTATSGVVSSVPLGGANGVATLDSTGKIPVTQLPSSVMEYKGTWNAATNTPTLVNGTGDPGDVYICNVAGTANFGAGPIVFATGDWVVYNGSIWQKSGGGSGLYVPYSGATNDVNLNTKNLFTNNVFEGFSSVAASGVQIVLTVASTPNYLITGSGGQTIKLPDATTLPNGSFYVFNNNQSSGAITVNNNSNTLVVSIPSGGYCNLELIDNSTAAGSWDRHFQAPSNVSWSTNTFDYPGSITSATWNGNTVAINRGGTGATTAITALANLGGTPLTRLISTTAPLLGGGDLTADRTLSITQATTSTNGYLSSTDWNTFNEKTGGSGTLNYVPKFTGIGKTLGNSLIYDNGTNVIIGDTTSSFFFDVNGTARFRSKVTIGDSTISQPGLIIAAGSANQSIQFFNAAGGVSGGGYGVLTVSGTTTSVNYKFSTWNSSNAFYIQDDGNIGIGTPVPNYKLDVSGTGNFTGQLKLGSTITNGTYTYTLPSLTGTLVVSSQITGTANYISKFSSTGLVNSLLWDNGTNVGVGNTNTTYTFDVTGTGRFTGSLTGTNANFNYVSFNNSASAAPTITGFSSLTFIANSSFLNMNIKRADGQNSSLRFPSDGFTHQYDLPTSDGTLALTSQITGTTNYLSKFTSTGLANSLIYDNGTNVGINTSSPNLSTTNRTVLDINGTSSALLVLSTGGTYKNYVGTVDGTNMSLNCATGNISFTNNTSELVRITAAGNLSIGNSNDTYKLDVSGTGRFLNNLYIVNGNALILSENGSNSGSATIKYSGSGSAAYVFLDAGDTITNRPFCIPNCKLGIGNTSPSYNLDVTGTGRFTGALTGTTATFTAGTFNPSFIAIGNSNGNGQIQLSSSANYKIGAGTDYGGMAITVGGSDRIYILNNGNVGIGTNSPSYTLDVQYSGNISQRIRNNSAGGTATLLLETANTFSGTSQAYVQCIGSTGGGQSQLVFATAGASGDSTATERMRITSGGQLLVGKTTSLDSTRIVDINGNFYSGGSSAGIFFQNRASSNAFGWYGNTHLFAFNTDVGNIAQITYNTGVYIALSDVNKKKDFEDSTIGLNEILNLKPTLYRMKSDETKGNKELGFIAQEVKEFIPQAYVESDEFIGLNYNAIVAALVKSIQELEARLKTLENK